MLMHLAGVVQVNKVKAHPGWPMLMEVVASYLPSLAPRQLTNVFWAVSLACGGTIYKCPMCNCFFNHATNIW
jgi:hypothetical protein